MACLSASAACGGPSTSSNAVEPPPLVEPSTPPNVSVVEDPIDFGLADCGGSAPAAKTVKITNSGGGTVSWTAELEAPGFSIVGATNGTFFGGGSVPVKVRASGIPATAAAGAVSLATLIVVIDKAKIFRIPLRVTAQGATLTVTPGEAVFGEWPINTQAPDVPVAIKNTGNKDVTVSFSQPKLTDFALNWTGSPAAVTIAAGATVPGAVARFRPSKLTLQSTSAPITVTGAVCGTSPTAVAMNGKGTGGVVGVSPGQLDFGKVNCGTKAGFQVFTILNSGNSSFNWTGALGLGAGSYFDISPAGGTVLAGSQTSVFVTPKDIPATSAVTNNLYGDTLTVTTDAANDMPHAVPLLMGARGAILSFSVVPSDYGLKTIFGPSTVQMATVSNTGNAAANVTLGTGTGSFAVSPNVSTSVSAGGTLNANVTFSPASFDANNDQLTMSTGDVRCAPLPGGAALSGQGKGVASQVAVGFGGGKRNGGTPAVGAACAVITGGHVACWGDNSFGQMGIGVASGTPQGTPVVVPGLSNVVAVAGGGDVNCARTSTGSAYCWGNNANRQTGTAGGPKLSPAQVPNLTNVISIDVHHRNGCAVSTAAAGDTSGKVVCWGMNHRGQLGSPGTGSGSVGSPPVDVAGLTDAVSVGVGPFGGCARRATNTVSCWGQNNYQGNLGNGTTNYNAAGTPVAVVSLTNVSALDTSGGAKSGGSGSSCAISGGTVFCWGDNQRAKITGVLPASPSTRLSTPTADRGCECGHRHRGRLAAWVCRGRGRRRQVLGPRPRRAARQQHGCGSLAGRGRDGPHWRDAESRRAEARRAPCSRQGRSACWGSNAFGQLGNVAATGLVPSVVTGF